jgi:hypothetical protein
MRQRGYAIAFALVLLAVIAGAYFGGRFVVRRFRQDFQFRPEWTRPAAATSLVAAATAEATLPARPTLQALPSTPTPIVVPTPIAPTAEPYVSPAPRASPSRLFAEPATAPTQVQETALPVASPTQPPTAIPAEPFVARGPVQASFGDCGGTYLLGLVTGPDGEPLAGVRLHLVDEFANEAFAVTKSGQADLGHYDFPVSGPQRRFSLSVVDAAGVAISRAVAFTFYGNAADAQATCYRIDWQRRY